jgi:hypothetical protein
MTRTCLLPALACCLLQAQTPTATAPRVVNPGIPSSPETPGRPPSDAIVLFDGTNLSHWYSMTKKGEIGEPRWKVENGYMEVVRGTGSLVSKELFGSAQIHVEWATPAEVKESSQRRGNSGVFLMRRWEIQILDSWENPTYPKGEAAALYGQAQPLVNACRKPGEWQSFDIIFDAPVFDGDKLIAPPYVTVLHNGVLVHNHVALAGGRDRSNAKDPFLVEGPLMLQDHPGPVRFRNVWVRPLANKGP